LTRATADWLRLFFAPERRRVVLRARATFRALRFTLRAARFTLRAARFTLRFALRFFAMLRLAPARLRADERRLALRLDRFLPDDFFLVAMLISCREGPRW
jgi:hypothetical protein